MKLHPTFTNYLITENGEVIDKKKNRKLKLTTNEKGYMIIGLVKDNKRYFRRVNRLVLQTYNPIENDHLYDAHHENEIKNDNRLENLKWELKGEHIREHKKGKVFSEEHRRKLGESRKGKFHSEESKRKISEANKGKFHSEETKRKISETKKGMKKETRQKISIALTGRKLSQSHIENLKGRKFSEEHRRKLSESHMGKKRKPFSEEHKRKLSEAKEGKLFWNNGVKSIKSKTHPGEGWVRGRL